MRRWRPCHFTICHIAPECDEEHHHCDCYERATDNQQDGVRATAIALDRSGDPAAARTP